MHSLSMGLSCSPNQHAAVNATVTAGLSRDLQIYCHWIKISHSDYESERDETWSMARSLPVSRRFVTRVKTSDDSIPGFGQGYQIEHCSVRDQQLWSPKFMSFLFVSYLPILCPQYVQEDLDPSHFILCLDDTQSSKWDFRLLSLLALIAAETKLEICHSMWLTNQEAAQPSQKAALHHPRPNHPSDTELPLVEPTLLGEHSGAESSKALVSTQVRLSLRTCIPSISVFFPLNDDHHGRVHPADVPWCTFCGPQPCLRRGSGLYRHQSDFYSLAMNAKCPWWLVARTSASVDAPMTPTKMAFWPHRAIHSSYRLHFRGCLFRRLPH